MKEPSAEGVCVAAFAAYAAGLSVVPPRGDGSKRPLPATWKKFQEIRASRQELDAWYRENSAVGVGVVTGRVSGNLEALDFDCREKYDQFVDVARTVGLGDIVGRIESGYVEDTPTGGVHWVYRCNNIERNQQLARRPKLPEEQQHVGDKVKALIETRGEGGYLVTAPSHGGVHPSGKPYMLRAGGFATIATISPEERRDLFGLARSFDELPKPQSAGERSAPAADRPGDDFAARRTWAEVLEPHGWTQVYIDGETTYWRRPGKVQGVSATTNHRGSDLFYVFTTSTEFEAPRAYGRFSVYAILNYFGDFPAAARALRIEGFGAKPGAAPLRSFRSSMSLERPWPTPPARQAYYGLAGALVEAINPTTEADPIAILVQLLVAFGNLIGRRAHFVAEADQHPMNLFVGIVGKTASGRKGSSWRRVKYIIESIDQNWIEKRLASGLSSGEGLIWAVRDPILKLEPIKEKGRTVGTEHVVSDEGESDKRLLVTEPELASTLRMLSREGNILSAIIRQAWEDGKLQTLTKNSPARATDAHISIIGHITEGELIRYLDRTEVGNGFANRFIWICVRRSKMLPEGGSLAGVDLTPLIEQLRAAAEFARDVGEMHRDEVARDIWRAVYPHLSEGKAGLFGAVIARAEPQVMRLACLYALLDQACVVGGDHLTAAIALWDYSERSASYIFGDNLGDPVADGVLTALRQSPGGLTRTQLRDHFKRNRDGGDIGRALGLLLQQGLATMESDPETGGRPAERWFATHPATTETTNTTKGQVAGTEPSYLALATEAAGKARTGPSVSGSSVETLGDSEDGVWEA